LRSIQEFEEHPWGCVRREWFSFSATGGPPPEPSQFFMSLFFLVPRFSTSPLGCCAMQARLHSP